MISFLVSFFFRSCLVQILQRHFKLPWSKFVSEIAAVHYAKFGDQVQLLENWHIEFKGGRDPNQHWTFDSAKNRFKETAGEYVCAFLNSEVKEGRIYYGVHDTGKIQGILVDNQQIDEIKLYFENTVLKKFDPSPSAAEVSLEWKNVENESNQSLFLCVVHVRSSDRLFWYDNVVYEKRDGMRIAMPPFKIRDRLKKEWMRQSIDALTSLQ